MPHDLASPAPAETELLDKLECAQHDTYILRTLLWTAALQAGGELRLRMSQVMKYGPGAVLEIKPDASDLTHVVTARKA